MEGETQQFLKKPKDMDRNIISSLRIYISTHPRKYLFLAVLILQLFFLSMLRNLPITTSNNHSTDQSPAALTENSISPAPPSFSPPYNCDSGRVYIYDLPPMFNKYLLENCTDSNPRSSRCKISINGGFGRKAIDLAGIVPEPILNSWFATDQFSLEVIFHNRMLNHRCRTLNPDSATAFFIPFYAGLALDRYLWSSNYTASDRDFHCEMLLNWLGNQSYWNRKQGWDHFLILGRISWDFRRSKDPDWGSSFIYMPAMKNITRLLIERNPWDYFDLGVPYPTGFHPRTETQVREWQSFIKTHQRKTLFCFAGATRTVIKNDFRSLLLKQCSESDYCRALDCSGMHCSNSTSSTLELFLNSEFCLQPRGDSFTRKSIFDCLIAGSIPVFFWRRTAYWQYQWHLPEEPESYSVFINRTDVTKNGVSIQRVLEGLGREKIDRMRETIVDALPRFVYAGGNEGLGSMRDAFDIAVDGVLRRFQQQVIW